MFRSDLAFLRCTKRPSLLSVAAAWMLNATMFVNIFVLHA
jgi:hypothetical protein